MRFLPVQWNILCVHNGRYPSKSFDIINFLCYCMKNRQVHCQSAGPIRIQASRKLLISNNQLLKTRIFPGGTNYEAR